MDVKEMEEEIKKIKDDIADIKQSQIRTDERFQAHLKHEEDHNEQQTLILTELKDIVKSNSKEKMSKKHHEAWEKNVYGVLVDRVKKIEDNISWIIKLVVGAVIMALISLVVYSRGEVKGFYIENFTDQDKKLYNVKLKDEDIK